MSLIANIQGQERDFKRAGRRQHPKRCAICRQPITGREVRIGENPDRWACNQCATQGSPRPWGFQVISTAAGVRFEKGFEGSR